MEDDLTVNELDEIIDALSWRKRAIEAEPITATFPAIRLAIPRLTSHAVLGGTEWTR